MGAPGPAGRFVPTPALPNRCPAAVSTVRESVVRAGAVVAGSACLAVILAMFGV